MTDVLRTTGVRAGTASFGPFTLVPAQHLLLEGDTPVHLGGRAFDILIALLERPGELVSKDELMARVWPDKIVEESNIKAHVAALRKALRDGQPGRRYLATVNGRGYRFVAPVALSALKEPAPGQAAAEKHSHRPPIFRTRPIGRMNSIDPLKKRLPRHRFITIVGTGGVGKTTVALEVADMLVDSYEHGVCFVDFSPFADPNYVPSTLASALGVPARAEDPASGLLEHLRDKQMLVVLDSCEHVIDAAAILAEKMFLRAPGVHILATSREPLRSAGEHVHRLSPLETPPHASPTASGALAYPSVQLFVERAASVLGGFELTDGQAPFVAAICRKLDGIPLAIELAASHINAFGVRQLSGLLDDSFQLRAQGRRTAVPRHQTLEATLAWSYDLLSQEERAVLCQLSVFAGAFTLTEASVVAETDLSAPVVVQGIASLVAKSLLLVDVGDAVVHYRMLDTTRAYARRKLAESGRLAEFVRRHVEYHRNLGVQDES